MKKVSLAGRMAGTALAAAFSAVASPPAGRVVHHKGSTRYAFGLHPRNSFYLPHQGTAEIARRQFHAQRDKARQLIRGQQLRDFEIQRFGKSDTPEGTRLLRRGNVIA